MLEGFDFQHLSSRAAMLYIKKYPSKHWQEMFFS